MMNLCIRWLSIGLFTVAAALSFAAEKTPQYGPVDPDYKHASPETSEKLADLKFGARIVWSQNIVLGLNCDGPMRQGGASEEFRKIYLTQYQLFNPVEFDADEWARLCVRAGMRYALTTTKMHNGFCLWPTKTTTLGLRRTPVPSHGSITVEEAMMHFDIMDTPLKRDVMKEFC